MSDTLITVIGIFVAAILMIVFPLMAVSNTNDDISQVAVQSLVSDFVNNIAVEGKITQDGYSKFLTKLYATGNTYDVQFEHQIMTTNPNKTNIDQLGENSYYSVYNATIIDGENGLENNEVYLLKKGDYIIVTVKNTNVTIATQIKNFAYKIVGKDTYQILADASARVVNTGKN